MYGSALLPYMKCPFTRQEATRLTEPQPTVIDAATRRFDAGRSAFASVRGTVDTGMDTIGADMCRGTHASGSALSAVAAGETEDHSTCCNGSVQIDADGSSSPGSSRSSCRGSSGSASGVRRDERTPEHRHTKRGIEHLHGMSAAHVDELQGSSLQTHNTEAPSSPPTPPRHELRCAQRRRLESPLSANRGAAISLWDAIDNDDERTGGSVLRARALRATVGHGLHLTFTFTNQ